MRHFSTAALGALLLFGAARSATAVTIDLGLALANSGFENGTTSQWTETKPNSSYIDPVPVDPVINPLDPCCNDGTNLPTLTAPAGIHFVGVLNPTANGDLKGKLAHDALAGTFASGTIFEVLVWANRGRLETNGNLNSTFGPETPPDALVQLRGWGAGAVPTVNPTNDDWSRSSSYLQTLSYTNWGTPGAWTSQVFQFTTPVALQYVALSIAGRNNNHDQYVALDIAAVPEPSSVLLLGLGVLSLAAARRRSR